MAVFFRGMSARRGGGADPGHARLRRRCSTGRISAARSLDKHSTGGVGDNVSLMLAPAVAACGAYRADDLRPRPRPHRRHARQARLDPRLRHPARHRPVPHASSRDVGCAIIGQTADLAPADRRLYAIRDVTATVESVPLITASILSKKLAAGLDSAGPRREDRQRRLHAEARAMRARSPRAWSRWPTAPA